MRCVLSRPNGSIGPASWPENQSTIARFRLKEYLPPFHPRKQVDLFIFENTLLLRRS